MHVITFILSFLVSKAIPLLASIAIPHTGNNLISPLHESKKVSHTFSLLHVPHIFKIHNNNTFIQNNSNSNESIKNAVMNYLLKKVPFYSVRTQVESERLVYHSSTNFSVLIYNLKPRFNKRTGLHIIFIGFYTSQIKIFNLNARICLRKNGQIVSEYIPDISKLKHFELQRNMINFQQPASANILSAVRLFDPNFNDTVIKKNSKGSDNGDSLSSWSKWELSKSRSDLQARLVYYPHFNTENQIYNLQLGYEIMWDHPRHDW
jgi:hypothetical protein